MTGKMLQVLPDFEILLEYPAGTDPQILAAAESVALVVSLAIVEDGVYIQGALLEAPLVGEIRLGFYRQPGRFVREYRFQDPELLSVTPAAGLPGPADRQSEAARQAFALIRNQIRPYRRW
jgi:hypothetical protein